VGGEKKRQLQKCPAAELEAAVEHFPVLGDEQDESGEQQPAPEPGEGGAHDGDSRSLDQRAAGLTEGALEFGR
jgi:hypothetical protein